MTFKVEQVPDDPAIVAFLQERRLWAAYGLCDLDEPYRRHSRFVGAGRDGRLAAVIVVYEPPGFSALLPFGDAGGVAAIVDGSLPLPAEPSLLVGEEHIEVMEQRYRVAQPWSMVRMAVNGTTFVPFAGDRCAEPLSVVDAAAIEALYATESDSAFFDPATLSHGVHFGVRDGTALIAVAGTHAWSRRYGMGAIGGVFTHPRVRGRGLATMTTGAVIEALLDAGVEDVVLNVRADNAPALAAYARLGFGVVRSFLEAQATERDR
jgi:GNAT superfamily N-acetyltransferase